MAFGNEFGVLAIFGMKDSAGIAQLQEKIYLGIANMTKEFKSACDIAKVFEEYDKMLKNYNNLLDVISTTE